MSRASLILSMSLTLGLGLTACGDDSGGGGGSETDTDATSTGSDPTGDPTTETPTSTTEDSTTGSSSTTGDTMDPDTGSGGEESSSGEPVDPVDADYRVNSLGVLDPPLTLSGFPANDIASNLLTTALTTDEDADGDLDLGFVLQFRPLNQADGASEGFGFANASCTAPQETSTCEALAETTVSEGTYASSSEECYAADPANLSGATVSPTAGPCFLAEYDALTIVAGLFSLPLTNVQIAATYVGEPAGNLVGGNIEGFLSTADAEEIVVELMGQETPLVDLLSDADQDGDGWVFHLSFTAVPTEWTGM